MDSTVLADAETVRLVKKGWANRYQINPLGLESYPPPHLLSRISCPWLGGH